jgi:hypothetical protein
MKKIISVIYSSNDEQWRNKLDNHLRVLKTNYPIELEYWDETITLQDDFETFLSRSSAIILLMSVSLLEQGIMISEKLRNRLKDKQVGGFPLFNLVIDRCQWKKYRWMNDIKVFPAGDRLLSDLDEGGSERTLADLATSVFDSLKLKEQINEGILGYFELRGVGNIDSLTFEPASRLNLITGDNGYGKSMLLECIWWALSGKWAQLQVLPNENYNRASIGFQLMRKEAIQSDVGNTAKSPLEKVFFNFNKQKWPENTDSPKSSAMVAYARVDGSFALWDPVKGNIPPPPQAILKGSPLVFNKWDVFNGIFEPIDGKPNRYLCIGLISVWIDWQKTPGSPFDLLTEIIQALSEYSGQRLKPSAPLRLFDDSRPMPSLEYPYGKVPVIHAAASVQRIISLAYLLAWLWTEHLTACELTRDMILLLDEAESHLHPKWQRSIIPSLLKIKEYFTPSLDIQFIITTHSPLLMASLEPSFDEISDSIFHMEMKDGQIQLNPQTFLKHGRVDHWLTSDTFELNYARSIEAENAIKKALDIQSSETPDSEEVKKIHAELCRVLGEFDSFWPRWIFFAEQHGVNDDSCKITP